MENNVKNVIQRMGGCSVDVFNAINIFLNTYVATYEGIATVLIVFVIFLKLAINRRITIIQFKKTVVSIPSEITFLLIGFLFSAIVGLSDTTKLKLLVVYVIILLFILVIQYALERVLDDKLSGKWKWYIRLCILFMYALSIISYIIIVFGGVY